MAKSKELSVNIRDTEWFNEMILEAQTAMDEFKDAMTEIKFTLQWHTIEFRHKIGQLLVKNEKKTESFPDLVVETAKSLDVSERLIQYCVKAARVYPDINQIPEGKSMTWGRLVSTYLTDGSTIDPKGCAHPSWKEVKYRECTKCGKREKI